MSVMNLNFRSQHFLTVSHYHYDWSLKRCLITIIILSSEGVAVITDETYDQLLDTFDNVEQEEFFEVSTFIKIEK